MDRPHHFKSGQKRVICKVFLAGLKAIYKVPSKVAIVEKSLQALEQKCRKQYAYVVKSWQNNWPELSAYFKYAPEVPKIIRTINIIERFHPKSKLNLIPTFHYI